ncbi:MFS transporter [Propioniciclava tarda]|uniref:MFS transporter n=1 Tax=Propioniciclava tarda TaxID=433330 RepID=A0A4Q9KP09_PROTD|nr:MFS transporter [Propioniciclava tarda]TBT96313.1 MFS transporter [Propioniciclava tarda]SMO35308.1 MFS transporter, PPP family, 3-phenylpropionic acid transporter [Propioniciclava tarda]
MRPPALSAPTLRYAALNAAFWASFCLLMAFASVFLLARGLTNTQIGLVASASGILSAVLQPVIAGLADRSRVPLRVWVAALAVVLAAAGGALLLPGASPLRDGILFGLLQATLQAMMPLVNAMGMAAADSGVPVDFGKARAFGSISFAIMSTLTGVAVASAGPDAIVLLLAAVQGLVIIAALTFVFSARSRSDADASDALPDPPPLDAAARRAFIVLVAGATGLFASQAAIAGFLFQVLRPLGGDASTMGLAFTLTALIEIIPMIFFKQLSRRWTPATLLRVASIGFTVKALLAWLAPNLAVFFVSQALQLVAFALFLPASVYYVDRLLPRAERARGQAYMTITITLGNVVAGVGGGYLLDAAGVPALLAAGTACAAIGAVGVHLGTRRSGVQVQQAA